MTKKTFYFLSFTWGLLYTTAGLFIALIMLLTGHKPRKWGWSWYFETGKKPWGGAEWGLIFLKDIYSGESLKNHEFGHAIQNCCYGPLMIPLVSLPSSLRYWFRRIGEKFGKQPARPYDDIWFEKQATQLGTMQIRRLRREMGKNHHI